MRVREFSDAVKRARIFDAVLTEPGNHGGSRLVGDSGGIGDVVEMCVEKLRACDVFSFQEDSVFLSAEIAAVTTNPGRLVFQAATLTEYPNAFSAEALRFQEGQQVGVNGIGLGRGHAVLKALVGFQCAIL